VGSRKVLNSSNYRQNESADLLIGAMVARIAVANTTPSIRDRVAAVVTFGDPVSAFDGQYTGAIHN
jgi:hypothetical protein